MPTLSALFGQEAALGAVRRVLEADSLPGTYLLIGPPGVGKGMFARAFGQAAACLNPIAQPFDACGVCESCRRVETDSQPEILTLQPFGGQLQIWQFWDRDNRPAGALSKTLNFAPAIGRKRVYIIDQADTLTESAANSLLKALEEPPPYALFLLLAPHAARVLPTILSRSQTIRLRPVPVEILTRYLIASHNVEPLRAATLAAYSEGRIGQAVQLALHPEVGEEIARVLDFAESLSGASPVRALRLAENLRKLAGQLKAFAGGETTARSKGKAEDAEEESGTKERAGRRQLATLFDLLLLFYRDLMALCIGGDATRSLVNRERATAWARLAQRGTPERWMRSQEALLLARRRLDANANINMVTEVLVMSLLAEPDAGAR
jgi:DNA polymerase-3 subunit delta'